MQKKFIQNYINYFKKNGFITVSFEHPNIKTSSNISINPYMFKNKIVRKRGKTYLQYRWEANEKFDMPIQLRLKPNEWSWVYPNKEWQEVVLEVGSKGFEIATHLFLMDVKKLK